MVRAFAALLLIASAGTAQQPPTATVTLPPAAVTVGEALASIQAQTGLTVTTTLDPKLPLKLERRDGALWPLLTEVATASGGRLTVASKGRAVAIDKGVPPPASIDGAFRVALKQVACRRDFDTGRSVTEVTLEIHWEPRLPVFRIDSEPRVTATTDADPTPRTPAAHAGKTAVSGALFTTVVRLDGVPRAATKLTLTGKFTVTAAAKMLQFRVADTSKPTTLTQEGVTLTLQPPRKIQDRWDVSVELVYPPSKAEFESFEAGVWLSRNRLQLIDPAGKPLDPINEDFREAPGKANLVYRFPAARVPDGRVGWSLVYETPSPLVEFDVAFTLSNIPLP
jgi:hypothetical protein